MLAARLLLALAALAAGCGAAGAQAVPEHALRYSRERGGSCVAMIPYYGPSALWIGRIAGERPLDVSSDHVWADRRVAESCFFTEAECRTWLARLLIDWTPRPGFAACAPGVAAAGGGRGGGGGAVIKP